MAADIDTRRILAKILCEGPAEPAKWCEACEGVGLVAIGRAVRYCLCPEGRRKKAYWLSLPAEERAEYEAEIPTLPDAIERKEIA